MFSILLLIHSVDALFQKYCKSSFRGALRTTELTALLGDRLLTLESLMTPCVVLCSMTLFFVCCSALKDAGTDKYHVLIIIDKSQSDCQSCFQSLVHLACLCKAFVIAAPLDCVYHLAEPV